MHTNPEKQGRHSIRLPDYDYSQPGMYFVTICAKHREMIFGGVRDGDMVLNEPGKLVLREWQNLPCRFTSIESDTFCVMPNHCHGIIVIVGAGLALPDEGAASSAPTLSDIIRAFKSLSAIKVNKLLSRTGQPLWQRNYYEHIIRDEKSLHRIQEYIQTNPQRWHLDTENPNRIGDDDFDTWLASFQTRPEKILRNK